VKGKFFLSVLALFLPVSLAAQVKPTTPADTSSGLSRYEIFAGADYISANQVKSSSALIGFNAGGSAKLAKWFGGVVDFGDYPASHGALVAPTVTTFLAGPEFYIPSGSLTGFVHVMFGGEHTSNASVKPDVAYAYAFGGGVEWAFAKKLSLRLSGDAILAATVQDQDNLGYSPHTRTNGRASAGIAYHF
jgi:hypothetical protein